MYIEPPRLAAVLVVEFEFGAQRRWFRVGAAGIPRSCVCDAKIVCLCCTESGMHKSNIIRTFRVINSECDVLEATEIIAAKVGDEIFDLCDYIASIFFVFFERV